VTIIPTLISFVSITTTSFMHLKELKTPLHHRGEGVSLVCLNIKMEIGKQIRWKVKLTHNPNQFWNVYGLGI